MKLHWGHVGGMLAATFVSAFVAAALIAIPWAPDLFPAIFLVALMFAAAHVIVIAMPLFVLMLETGVHPTLPRVLAAGLLIGTIPFTIIAGLLAWWASIAGLCGSYAFWLASGFVQPWEQQ